MAETRKRVLAVAMFWYLVSVLGPRHGPPGFERFNKWFTKRYTAWQLSLLTMVGYYLLRNIDAILNLHPKMARHLIYEPKFDLAVRAMTAANAGFLTAQSIRPKVFQDMACLVFTIYYIFTPDHALEKVRKFNENPSVLSVRTSFEIMNNPYLALVSNLFRRPKLMGARGLKFEIPRPRDSIYLKPVRASLWYDKPLKELQHERRIIFHIHGGGFLTNSPELHADSLIAWAKKTQVPIVAIDYHLAPEYQFPYALDECFDAYRGIVESNGLAAGIVSQTPPSIIVTGDSAGGNFSAALTIKIITSKNKALLRPSLAALMLTYPALDLGPVGFYGEREMAYFEQQAHDDEDRSVFETKNDIIELYKSGINPVDVKDLVIPGAPYHDNSDLSHLSISSRVLFMSDKVIPAEGLYVMVLMYIGTDRGIDFHNDPLVSPLWAKSELLEQFPRCFVICGTCDPLVDDSVIFASRLRNARRKNAPHLDIHEDILKFKLLKGLSHGFLQFETVYPDTHKLYKLTADWFLEGFEKYETERVVMPPKEIRQLKKQLGIDASFYRNPFPGY